MKMKGIIKLKVPTAEKTPKLFVITLSSDGKQRRFEKVAWDLASAINMCWYNNYQYTIHDYICHNELSVNQINQLFKNFNPLT